MRLDWLERALPFAEVLEIQTRVVGDTEYLLGALIRDVAMGRISGVRRVRILLRHSGP
ncbi:hypothetical protein [Oceaniovalibus sp. ACAM 378]|uniref:hypothetical protein n=1 Tax=Oceaniovalibus sp. ACAM 378 TaxID=2599923 RepID=UPI001652828B|nr:hypothetical protein [Oceaniovalibus sp. ACAM 378]